MIYSDGKGKKEINEENNRSNFNFGREREKVELGRSKVQREKERK